MDLSNLFWLIAIGLLAGIVSGLVGVGGGIIMVPMLVFILGMNQYSAQGTSIAVMLPPVGIAAALSYHKEGFINWKYAIIIGVMFIIGGWMGSKVAMTLDPKLLRKIFGVILAYVAIKMIMK